MREQNNPLIAVLESFHLSIFMKRWDFRASRGVMNPGTQEAGSEAGFIVQKASVGTPLESALWEREGQNRAEREASFHCNHTLVSSM